jgi:Haem-binding domain
VKRDGRCMRVSPPGSWLIERDIVEARKKMDLSQWEEMPAEKQDVLMAKIIQEAKSGDMPPIQYLALHWNAKLSTADVRALSMLGKSPGGSEAALGEAGDAARGKMVFEKRWQEGRKRCRIYWFEDAASGLVEQLEYLRSVKRLTASELESFTEGLSIPESVTSRPASSAHSTTPTKAVFRSCNTSRFEPNEAATTGRNAHPAPARAMTERWTI